MSKKKRSYSRAAVLCTLLGGACTANVFAEPCAIPQNATDEERTRALAACYSGQQVGSVPATYRPQVDILFLIDNSPSMSAKQQRLADKFAAFMQTIERTGADYHVAVATTDVGSTVAEDASWGSALAACNSFKGDDGVLQNKPCTDRTEISGPARQACASVCPDPQHVPKNGARFISKVAGITNVPVKLERSGSQTIDTGPIRAFQCLALVGDGGCGLEAPLEAARRALDGHAAENAGFLRSNATLAVIFITDEDDCSMPLASRTQNAPATRDCATPDQNASYDCYDPDFRCLARSVQCDQPLNTPGDKTGCHERADNYLERVEKYYTFFSRLRPASRLFVSGIWTRPSITQGGRLVVASGTGGSTSPLLNRAGNELASCYYKSDPSIFGQAQLRLSKFAGLFGKESDGSPSAPEYSICEIDGYEQALGDLATRLVRKFPPPCAAQPIKRDSSGDPICLVGDVDAGSELASPDVFLPVCGKKSGSTTCCDAWASSQNPTPADEKIKAACQGEPEDCYCAVKSTVGVCSDNGRATEVVGVARKNGELPPAGKVISFRCASTG